MRSILQRRRTWVLAAPLVVGTLALAACGSSSAPGSGGSTGSLTTISVGLAGNIFDLPLRVAEQDGYYKREGLNVKFVTVTATTDNAALESGSIAFLPQAPAGWAEALVKGSPQVAVENEATGIPLGLVVNKQFAASHGITSATSAASVAKDLVGSTGGLSSTWTQRVPTVTNRAGPRVPAGVLRGPAGSPRPRGWPIAGATTPAVGHRWLCGGPAAGGGDEPATAAGEKRNMGENLR